MPGGDWALRWLSAHKQVDSGGTVGNIQLADYGGNVRSYRTGCDHQAAGDLGGRTPLREQLEDLPLAARQALAGLVVERLPQARLTRRKRLSTRATSIGGMAASPEQTPCRASGAR